MGKTLVFLISMATMIVHHPQFAWGPEVPRRNQVLKAIQETVHISIQEDQTKIVLGWNDHIVRPGDTLWTLSRDYVVLEWMIHRINPGLDRYLQPGQVVKVPLVAWKPYEGSASWYGPGFHGKKAASGRVYNQNEISVAHESFPIGLELMVVRPANNRSVVAKVNDRGSFRRKYGREVDLSYRAAQVLEMVGRGVDQVKIVPLNTHLAKWVSGYQAVS